MAIYSVPKESLGGSTYTYSTTPVKSTGVAATNTATNPSYNPSSLNSYQQEQLAKLQQMQNMNPNSLSSNNSIFDPSQYNSEGDWMASDLEYKSYAQDAADGDPNAQKAMAARAAQLDQIYKSGSAQQGMINANYTQQVQQAQNGFNYSLAHPDGGDSFMDNFMGTVFPAVVGAFVGAGALGALSGAGGLSSGSLATNGAAGADVPFSTIPTGVNSLPNLTSIAGGTSGTAAGGTAAAGLGGTGAIAAGAGTGAASTGIPQVIINGSLGGGTAAISPGLGTAGALVGAGALGALSGGPSSLPALDNISGVSVPDSSLPPLVMPSTNPDPSIPNSDITPPEGTGLGGLPGGTPGTTPSIPNLGSIIGGIGTIGSGIAGYVMNQADKDYYQDILDKLNGMYAPGTPEATFMQNQMNAKDAAAGRNSQYGVRSEELNAQLAQQRANIMTSPGYVTLAQDARGHYDNSLNSMFGALGQASTGGTNLNNLIGSIPNLLSQGSNAVNAGSSYLSKLFGGGS